jgi:hypothetical protein
MAVKSFIVLASGGVWCHDIQYNDIKIGQSASITVMLNVVYVLIHLMLCRYAECRYAECRGAIFSTFFPLSKDCAGNTF